METTRLEGSGLSIPTCYVTPDGDQTMEETGNAKSTLFVGLFDLGDRGSRALAKIKGDRLVRMGARSRWSEQ